MEQDLDLQRACRLIELRDYFYEKFDRCDIVNGRNTIKLIGDHNDYLEGITRETFVGTDQEWKMYQEVKAIKLLLKL